MSSKGGKPSRFEGQEKIQLAESFLNKAHGFATIERENLRATRFVDLAHIALRGGIISAHDAANTFQLDVDKVKAGRSTGIKTQDRNDFITVCAMRAYDIAHNKL